MKKQKPLKVARSKSELVRTATGMCQLVLSIYIAAKV